MHHTDLSAAVSAVISAAPDAARDSIHDRLYLSIPQPPRHNGSRVRLFGGGRGPLAAVVCGARGRLTVYVSARRLREYLTRQQ